MTNDLLIEDYISRQYSNQELSQKYGISKKVIWKFLVRNNVPMKGKGSCSRVPIELFTEQSAERDYWLGWIVSDGTIIYNQKATGNNYYVDITTKDLEIIELYKKFIGASNLKIYKKGKDIEVYSLRVANKRIAEYLISLGLTPRKSKTVSLSIPLNWDIFRGIFDGDGSVRANRYEAKITTGSTNMRDQLLDFLKEYDVNCVVRVKGENKDCFDVIIENKSNFTKLFNLMYYNNNDLKLTRKYSRFVALLSNK